MSELVRELTQDNWDREVLSAEGRVLVDFWAEWCPPCRVVGPLVDRLAAEFAGRATVGKLDVDRHPAVAARYGIRSIPTLLVFEGGQIVERRVGAQPKEDLARLLAPHAVGR